LEDTQPSISSFRIPGKAVKRGTWIARAITTAHKVRISGHNSALLHAKIFDRTSFCFSVTLIFHQVPFLSIYGMIQVQAPLNSERLGYSNIQSMVPGVMLCTPDVTSRKCAFLVPYAQKANCKAVCS